MPASTTLAQAVPATTPEQDDRIAQLESTVAVLQREVAALREKVDNLFG